MTTDALSTTFAALADPTRRAILARLTTGEASVTELAQPFAMSMPAISKHLKVLERAGLIARGRAAQWRPCRIKAGPLKDVSDWVERYREIWEQRFDRLDAYLAKIQNRTRPRNGSHPPLYRSTLPGTRRSTASKLRARKPGSRKEGGHGRRKN